MRFLILSLFTALVSFSAQAGSLTCASSDTSLKYTFVQPDGGANIGSSEELVLNGETLNSRKPFGGAELHLANFSLGKAVWKKTYPEKDFYKVTRTLGAMIVTSAADGSKLFDDLVYCQKSDYVGPPRP